MPRRPLFLLAPLAIVCGGLLFLALQVGRDHRVLRRLGRLDPPLAVLADPREDPARPPGAWVLIALGDRGLFDRAAAFCREHRERQDLPLPNCDNVLVADRLLPVLPIHELRRESAHAR